MRVQGTYVSDREIDNVTEFVKNQMVGYAYDDETEKKIEKIQYPYSYSYETSINGEKEIPGEKDILFEEAGKFIIEKDKASIGMLQRIFKIGFNRAARIMDQLAESGVVGEEEGIQPRRVLMSPEQFQQFLEENSYKVPD